MILLWLLKQTNYDYVISKISNIKTLGLIECINKAFYRNCRHEQAE